MEDLTSFFFLREEIERISQFITGKTEIVQAYLEDNVGSVPDHHNKASSHKLFGCLVHLMTE